MLKIPFTVIFFHLLLVSALLFFDVTVKNTPVRKITVREIAFKSEPIMKKASPSPSPSPPPAPAPVPVPAPPQEIEEATPEPEEVVVVKEKEAPSIQPKPAPKSVAKKVKPQEKKIVKKEPVKKSSIATQAPTTPKMKTTPKTPPKKKQPETNNSELIALMKKSLATIDTHTKVSSGASAGQVGALKSEKIADVKEAVLRYEDEIAIFLKHRLKLNDSGEVKIHLTLNASGKVTQVKVQTATSDKDKNLVEEKVPKITFPPFNESMKGKTSHTFLITLKSD